MYETVYDIKAFYNGMVGRVVRRVIQQRIREIWPNVAGMRILGCGYATPYLRSFMDEAERVTAIMHAPYGAHPWPYHNYPGERNLACLAEESELPIETNSVDRVLLVHNLEYSQLLAENLKEIWRVLKSNGRILVIVPNRSGWWSRADWAPFGHGRPYKASQIQNLLRDHMFVHERCDQALFVPPIKYSLFLKSAGVYEQIGRRFLPVMAGVHIVEASKQLYARADHGSGSRVMVRGRRFFPRPATQGTLGRVKEMNETLVFFDKNDK
jgi:SAM-dependent methyltransferase